MPSKQITRMLPTTRAPQTLSKEAFVTCADDQEDELQAGLQGANELAAAYRAACEAQLTLKHQADNVDLILKVAAGKVASDAQLPRVLLEVQEAFAQREAALQHLQATRARVLRQGGSYEEPVGPLAPAVAALRRLLNDRLSPSRLLALPDNVLHLIALGAGPHTRLVCHRLAAAHGAPGSTMVWPLDPADIQGGLSHPLLQPVLSWRWCHALHELRLDASATLDPAVRDQLAAALPSLRRLSCLWHLPSGQRPSAPDGPPPAWGSLTALTCIVPADDHALELPYHVPGLQRLQLVLRRAENMEDDDRSGMTFGAALQPLTALTHLGLLTEFYRRGWDRWAERVPLSLTAGAQRDFADALRARAGSLASLHLEHLDLLGLQHRTVLAALQLQSLALEICQMADEDALWELDWRMWRVPPLRQALQHLQLVGPPIWVNEGQQRSHDLACLVDTLGHCGSASLLSLVLPQLCFVDEAGKDLVRLALQAALSKLPRLTSLTACTHRTRWASLKDAAAESAAPPLCLAALGQLAALRHVALWLYPRDLAEVACLQPLAALTHLEVWIALQQSTSADVDSAAPAQLAQLTQLRRLLLGTNCFHDNHGLGQPPEQCHGRPVLQQMATEAAARLPLLRELDVGDMGPLTGRDGALLEALLGGGCAVRRLVVHYGTAAGAAEAGGITDRQQLELLKRRQGDAEWRPYDMFRMSKDLAKDYYLKPDPDSVELDLDRLDKWLGQGVDGYKFGGVHQGTGAVGSSIVPLLVQLSGKMEVVWRCGYQCPCRKCCQAGR